MSLIFFWADFSTFSYLNCFSHNLGGIHKPCGPSKTRGRDCLAAYGINQFDVQYVFCVVDKQIAILKIENPRPTDALSTVFVNKQIAKKTSSLLFLLRSSCGMTLVGMTIQLSIR